MDVIIESNSFSIPNVPNLALQSYSNCSWDATQDGIRRVDSDP